MNTLWRLHTSPYFPSYFRNLEEKLAQNLGLAYHEGLTAPTSIDKSSKITVITNTHCKLPKDVATVQKNINLLIHANSGFDNIPLQWAKSCDFPIILGNPIRAHGVSNMILSHLFNHLSPIHEQSLWDSKRTYDRKLLNEMSVLILGNGHVGQILEKVLKPLCKNIAVVDPIKGRTDLDSRHDIIIPVPSLNKSSIGLIDKLFLDKQSKELILINCSRGPVVNMNELIMFLSENSRATAYIDVFESEPYDFKKSSVPNLKMTSHIAGVFKNLHQVTLDFEQKVIEDFTKLNKDIFLKEYSELCLQNRSEEDFL